MPVIFAAVDDLLADLAERHGHGEPHRRVGSVDVGHYLVDASGGHQATSLVRK
ncbi:MAG: hypothetical protein OES24_16275 [Acidimicrobiia bacterium]|nr:hypothetical protein [Acidimicrobiia bacterium]